jgi:hypothetical protein
MEAACFSEQFEINYDENRGKSLKTKAVFYHMSIPTSNSQYFAQRPKRWPLFIIIFVSRMSMFYQPVSVERINVRVF